MHTETNQQLTQLANKLKHIHFNDEQSSQRTERYSLRAGSIWLNYARNPITQPVMDALVKHAKKNQLTEKIQALFSGVAINKTENRAVKHWLLRAPLDQNDADSIAVHRVLDKMQDLVEKIEDNSLLNGTPIKDVICIGIGGSELGSRLVYEALTMGKKQKIRAHFVANIDSVAIAETIYQCTPENTLFLIISKSFVSFETSKNFSTLKKWFCSDEKLSEEDFNLRSCAITANTKAALSSGIPESQIFEFWDWVGGRFSLWSAVGLPIAISCGMPAFKELLAGAHAMDEHFKQTAFEKNLPVTLGLLHIWYSNYLHFPTRGVIPYAQNLKSFPEYLQQLEMESLGKSVSLEGNNVDFTTSPVIWGSVGSNAQHAFFQLLHQGTQIAPLDFIAAIEPCDNLPPEIADDLREHHTALLASCLAQSQSLMNGGQTREDAHGKFMGNRPSNLILLDQITPYNLGELLALYEHKVFVQSAIWGINAFDQFGVELGKQICNDILSQTNGKLDFEAIKKTFDS